MKPVKLVNVKNPVCKIKVIHTGMVYVFDSSNTIRIFTSEFKLKNGIKIKMPSHNPFENTVDITCDGNYIAIAEVKGNKTFLYDIQNKKMKYKFGWHKGEVLNVSFDWDGEYLLTGGADGRAYIWSINLGRMLTALPPHPDYILSGGFSKNNLWVSTGSYDKLITITNITSTSIYYRKKMHRGAVNKIKFFNGNIMISADKTGELIKWDFRKGKILNRFENMADMVVDFVSDEKQEFLFAVTKEKRVYLYDFESAELILQDYIKLDEYPTSLEYNVYLKHLYVGCVDGSVYVFELLKDKEDLKNFIDKKEYSKAYELINKNPFLKKTKEYKRLETIWEKTISAIQKLLEKGEVKKAQYMFEPFKNEPVKRNIFQNILNDFGEFEKFKNAVVNMKYPLAYSLARKYPVYKESLYFKKMEKDFKKVFNKARELIKLGKTEAARDMLKRFRGVSEKAALIQSLFNEKMLYDMLKRILLKKNFKEFFDFIKRYPFLVDTDEYEKAMRYAKALYEKANEAVKKGNYKAAMRYTDILEEFPEYREKAKQIKEEANNISNFLFYLADKDFDRIEKTVEKYPYLENLDDYQQFLKYYKSIIKNGEKYAVAGDVNGLKHLFKNYVKYELFNNLVYQLVKRAYLNQIMLFLKQKDLQKALRGIKNYIKLFGFDNEIGDLSQMAKKLGGKFTLENYEKSVNLPFASLPDNIAEIEF